MARTVTQLLQRWQAGDEEAMRALAPQTIEALRALARKALRGVSGTDLQADELINEAYIKLADLEEMSWENRLQFFGFAARVMRNILLDRYRRESAAKRGGGKDLTLFDQAQDQPLSNEDLGALVLGQIDKSADRCSRALHCLQGIFAKIGATRAE